ncbi:fungal specific transcription factor domain-containing protein [Aspergillus stella-maris]|uniref:fungal specific transcription factor domain-containing protein n=1 Tax=Aspergillus stella-maris TaxID=1810926 RepID=UPI003CCCF0D7
MRRLPKRDLSQYRRRQNAGPLSERRPAQTAVPSSSGQAPAEQTQSAQQQDHQVVPAQMNDDDLLEMLGDQRLMFLGDQDMSLNVSINVGLDLSWMSMVPLTESQMINRRRLDTSQDPTWTKRQALESALSVAGRIIGGLSQEIEAVDEQGQRYIPSAEFLYWMLNDIGSIKFGAFISDYFRHIGKDDLKHMGLSILTNTASPTDSILYTVCVNSIAFKFLNATLGTGTADDALAERLGQSALLYRETAKAALKQIPLLTKPSFTLLQALLCGIFLHQGSGDTNACRELAKIACRVAMDIGLHPGAADMQNLTEAEYYCFAWCYMLDRNYAWKYGGPRFLQLEPDAVISPAPAQVSISNLLLLYLELAKVQDAMIPFLGDLTKASRENAFTAHGVGTSLVSKMENIRAQISEINSASPNWKGLDSHSEIATLEFAYHSILTTLLHLRQMSLAHDPNRTISPAETYLNSARSGLNALLTLCASSDHHQTVAYLHWTLLYYPITACLALFCNAIATSHSGDFAILSAVSQCLAKTGDLSPRVAAMQSLLGEFVKLSRGCFLGLITAADSHPDNSGRTPAAAVQDAPIFTTGPESSTPIQVQTQTQTQSQTQHSLPRAISSGSGTPAHFRRISLTSVSGSTGQGHGAQAALTFPFPVPTFTSMSMSSGIDFGLGLGPEFQDFGIGSLDGAPAVGGSGSGEFPVAFEEFLEL